MRTKKCFKCLKTKPLNEFYKHSRMADGHLNKCKDCTRRDVANNLAAHRGYYREYDWERHHRSKARFLSHKYYGIRTRAEGRARRKSGATGKPYLTRDEWQDWCERTKPVFNVLWQQWEQNGWKRADAPSIDRIDNSRGYEADNLQWLTNQQNSQKYKHEQALLRGQIVVRANGKEVGRFWTQSEAAKFVGGEQSAISKRLRGKCRKPLNGFTFMYAKDNDASF